MESDPIITFIIHIHTKYIRSSYIYTNQSYIYYSSQFFPFFNFEIFTTVETCFHNKGPYTYYVITLGGGGPDTNDDIDDALRGEGG